MVPKSYRYNEGHSRKFTDKGRMVLSMTTITKSLIPGLDSQWGNYGATAYLLLKPGTNANRFADKISCILERRNGTEMKKIANVPTLFLEPLRDVYLRSTRDGIKQATLTMFIFFRSLRFLFC